MGGGGVESLQQDLREAGLPDPSCAVHAGAPQRHQQAGAQQALHPGPARDPTSLQPQRVPRPVEDGGVVPGKRGWRSADPSVRICIFESSFQVQPHVNDDLLQPHVIDDLHLQTSTHVASRLQNHLITFSEKYGEKENNKAKRRVQFSLKMQQNTIFLVMSSYLKVILYLWLV